MIVKMRKMDLLLYHREQAKFLDELRGLGVVHITSEQTAESSVAQELKGKAQVAQRALDALKRVQFDKNIPASMVVTEDVPRLLSRYEECDTKRERIEQEFASLSKDNATLAPWGHFDPKVVKRLADVGVDLKFYTMPEKKFEAIDRTKLILEVAAIQDGTVYFVVVSNGDAPDIAGAEEARLPEMSLKDLNAKVMALEMRRAEVTSDMDTLASHVAEVEKHCAELQNDIRFEHARTSMAVEAEGKLFRLSGWVPKQNEEKVKAFLQGYSAYATFRDPTDADAVPVHLKSGKLSKLFEPILGLYVLPNYREVNFAPLIAPFFIIFFGLCLGDVGYGALLFLGSLFAFMKVGPKFKPFMMLGIIFGVSTLLSGFLLNGFFGQPIFGGEGVVLEGGEQVIGKVASESNGIFSPTTGLGNAVLAPITTASGTVYPAMALALLVGFIQMFFGYAVKSYIGIRNWGWAYGLEPISLISMAFGAVVLGAQIDFLGLGIGSFAIGRYNVGALLMLVPVTVAQGMLFGGIVLLLLSNNLKSKFYIRPLSGLWALYNFITGFLSNILSYLRLFALGLAGGLLGAAVNQVALMMRGDGDVTGFMAVLGTIGMVVIMVGGHAVNLALATLGAFVHPLRLTFVEFYGAVGFQGGGKPYVPFAKVEN